MKKILLFLLFVFINFSFLFAENWTLSATQFTVEDSSFTTESEKTSLDIVAKQLPSLILDSFPMNLNRTVYPEEIFQQELYKIEKERQSHYSSLINQIKTRDALFLSYTGIELKKKIENAKKNILSTEEKIEELKISENELIEKFNSDKKKTSKISAVSLYQNDSTKLFDYENSNSKEKISASSINGLITGKIIPYGNYVKVESVLTLYPEGKVLASAKEVGLMSEVEFLASSIMNQFLSSIINENLVQTDIFIYPQEAGEKAVVFIEDYVLRGKSVSTKFTPGQHSIRVESPGYETIYFSHNYLAGEDKTISINMKKVENLETYFTVENKSDSQFDLSSQIYLNSVFLGNNPISVLISDKTYIGEIVSNKNEDNYSFFILKNGFNSKNLQNQKNEDSENLVALQVELPEAKENLSKRIDKSRKRMYWSYGGLILSLPLYYFAKGNYDLCQENSSIIDSSNLETWKTASNVTMYASIGAGVNFLVQLILYLVDANKVVPKTVEPKLINENEVNNLKSIIEETRQKEIDLKAQEEIERQKKLEEEKLQEESSEQGNISSENENIETEILENENTNSKEGE